MIDEMAAYAAAHDMGRPGAVKRGRNPAYPYVLIVVRPDGSTYNPTRRIAYATREEAVAEATAYIAHIRAKLLADLLTPRMRALREQHGFPRELPA